MTKLYPYKPKNVSTAQFPKDLALTNTSESRCYKQAVCYAVWIGNISCLLGDVQ